MSGFKKEQFKVISIDYHRNGIGGIGFHIILFQVTGDADVGKDAMLATVFPEEGAVAVVSVNMLVKGDIQFASNSWRGDNFEPVLRELIKDYNDSWHERFKNWNGEKELEKAAKKMAKALGAKEPQIVEAYPACSMCNEGFTEEEWQNRHSDDEGNDCHAVCCLVCKPRVAII